jgi:NADPH:quinone reductase-like Zn-dependent oxidoreductase
MKLGLPRRTAGDPTNGRTNGPATAQATMRAVVQDGYGGVGVLRLARIATPTIGDKEVLLRVHAAGLDRGTWHLMTGRPYLLRLIFGLRRPRQPVAGRDVAGTVVGVGPAVTRFAVGDEVFGVGPGSFAEYAVAPENKLVRKPASLAFERAAVVPVSATVALQALDAGRVQPGQHVLITGASGGVGTYAVQLAAALGAHVTGVCGTTKADLVRSLGAEHVVDYTREDFADRAHRYDVIIDIAGNPALSRLRRALTRTGTVVLVGGEEGGKLTGGMIERQLVARIRSLLSRQRFTSVLGKESGSDLQRVTEYIESGTVTPSVDSTYSMDQVPEAMRRLDAGEVRGKIAITI